MSRKHDTREFFYCLVHRTATRGGCVACRAEAAVPKSHPLPDGPIKLELKPEDAAREAEVVRWRANEDEDEDEE